MQGALELLGIPYTGSGVMASALCMDKVQHQAGVAGERPAHAALRSRDRAQRLERGSAKAGPAAHRQAGARGLHPRPDQSAAGRATWPRAYELAARHDRLVLAEEFVAGEELTAGFLGEQALPLIRIEAPQGNYDYQNKYFTDDTKYICPCGLPDAEERAIQDLVMRSREVLGCSGWGRADLIRRADGIGVAAGDEYLARHDRPQPGADGGEGGGHLLRGAGGAHPGDGACGITTVC